nr:hypothetical protein [Burkholderia seminalis]
MKDPIGSVGGINVYQYADNPTGWIDPLGLAKQCGCPCGVEPHGNQPSPRPSGYQSHHIIQDVGLRRTKLRGTTIVKLLQFSSHKTRSIKRSAIARTRVATQ